MGGWRSCKMSLPLLWEFPGGKVEANESEEEALIRELQEELNVTITVGAHLAIGHAPLNKDHAYERISLNIYRASLGEQEPKAREHAALRWVDIKNLNHYAFPEADLPAVIALLLEAKNSRTKPKADS